MYDIMSKSKSYKKQNTEKQVVCEPVMDCYSVSAMDNFMNSVPKDVLIQAIDFAIIECGTGHCIPHAQVDAIVKERMGWK